ncbi:MAG TPA: hypothetical protein VHY57_00015 [Rhizomicrobium sp.]|nr:hypothetical protein [Rhizomicrobium sp.]
MTAAENCALADSMIRMYGLGKAFSMADRYASDCTANGDDDGHSKWATAAARIAMLIELEEKFGDER